MSKLTTKILHSVDYENIKNTRRSNFEIYDSHLSRLNEYNVSIGKNDVPLCYPLVVNHNQLRELLKNQRIYIPYYWPKIEDRYGKNKHRRRCSDRVPL